MEKNLIRYIYVIISSIKTKNEKFIEKLYKLSKETLSHDFLNTSLDNISKLKTILYMTIDEIGDGLIFSTPLTRLLL